MKDRDGATVGGVDGATKDGLSVGETVGNKDGAADRLGACEGLSVGGNEGEMLGLSVGGDVGESDGTEDTVGDALGATDGATEGE